jgi:hypothetical protein
MGANSLWGGETRERRDKEETVVDLLIDGLLLGQTRPHGSLHSYFFFFKASFSFFSF